MLCECAAIDLLVYVGLHFSVSFLVSHHQKALVALIEAPPPPPRVAILTQHTESFPGICSSCYSLPPAGPSAQECSPPPTQACSGSPGPSCPKEEKREGSREGWGWGRGQQVPILPRGRFPPSPENPSSAPRPG